MLIITKICVIFILSNNFILFTYNNIAIKLYEKYGFKKIGTHKNYFNIEETYYDKILMDLYI